MNRLQQRRQRHRRRQGYISKLRAAGWLVSVVVLFCFPLLLPATRAYFTDRAEAEPHTFRATTFADNLALAPGNSNTNNSPGNPGPAFDVAQTVGGQIYLDFGTYPAGNNRNFPSVLVVSNIGDRLLTLDWHFCGVLAPFFKQAGPVSLAPGRQAVLDFKLDTGPDAQPGEYQGMLYLTALNCFIIAEIPARLGLAAPPVNKKKSQESTVSDTVYGTVYENPEEKLKMKSPKEKITDKPDGDGNKADKTEQQLTDDAVSTDEQTGADHGGQPAVPVDKEKDSKDEENKGNDNENAGQGQSNKSDGADGKTGDSESINKDMDQSDDGSESAGQLSNGPDGGEPGSAGVNDGGGSSDGNSTDSSS
ncbi:MAG: hypothetical protein DDT21_01949 [Syntrophomonadaceae bacterium]|nr:hypothetical protein [Bacillota bacterium]